MNVAEKVLARIREVEADPELLEDARQGAWLTADPDRVTRDESRPVGDRFVYPDGWPPGDRATLLAAVVADDLARDQRLRAPDVDEDLPAPPPGTPPSPIRLAFEEELARLATAPEAPAEATP